MMPKSVQSTAAASSAAPALDRGSGGASPLAGKPAHIAGVVSEFIGWGPRGFRVGDPAKPAFVAMDDLSPSQRTKLRKAAKSGASVVVTGVFDERGFITKPRVSVMHSAQRA